MQTKDLKLVRPDSHYESSFRSAFSELSTISDQQAWIYLCEADHDTYFKMPFEKYVGTLLLQEVSPVPNFVCDTVYWALLEDEIVGRISLRHELNDFLKVVGGHIGYIVKPSSRSQGIATEMLRLCLQTNRAKSIGRLLITCDETNLASKKVITNVGGVLESVVELSPDRPRKMRFWIEADLESRQPR